MPLYELDSFSAAPAITTACRASVRGAMRPVDRADTNSFTPACASTSLMPAAFIRHLSPSSARLLAVLYTGGHYMAFRDRARIETFTEDFDMLIREATVTARDLPDAS